MRKENLPYKEAQVQFLRLWKEYKAKELQLAEEIIMFLKETDSQLYYAEAAEISMKFLASASFADAHYAEVPEWPNGTEEMSKLRSIWRKVL